MPSSERCSPSRDRRRAPPGASSPTRWPSTSTAQPTSGVRFQTCSVAAARHDERPGVERVRRDEGDRHRVEPPDEHRARRSRGCSAVEPDGVEQITPSHGERAEVLAADRPLELDHAAERRRSSTTTSLTATSRSPPTSTSSVGSSTTSSSPANARATPALELVARRSTLRKPTRPKLTPITGTPVPRKRVQRAQHRPVAAEHDRDAATSSGGSVLRSSPARRARRRSCAQPPRAARAPRRSPRGRPCVTTAARAHRLSRRHRRSSGRAHRELGLLGLSTGGGRTRGFPSGPGRPESTTPSDPRAPAERRLGERRAARAGAPPGRGRRRLRRPPRGPPRTAA